MSVSADDGFELFSSVRHDPALLAVCGSATFAHAGWNYKQQSPYYMLDFHRDRLLRAATHWGWDTAVSAISGGAGLEKLEQVLSKAVRDRAGRDGPSHRCRITLGRDGRLDCQAFAVTEAPIAGLFPPRLPPPGFMTNDAISGEDPYLAPLLSSLRSVMGHEPYTVTLDVDKTESSPYTHYKTTRRQMYDGARQRASITGLERREVLLVNADDGGAIMDGSISTPYFWRSGRWVTPPVPPKYLSGEESGSGGLDGTTRRWALERGLAEEDVVTARSLRDGEECWLSNGVRGFLYARITLSPGE